MARIYQYVSILPLLSAPTDEQCGVMHLAPDTTAIGSDRQLARLFLRSTWRAARQVFWGIDAASRLRHGLDVPADHGARRETSVTCSAHRPR